MSLKFFGIAIAAATALTITVQETANAAALRFVQQVGTRFDYGLTVETPSEFFNQNTTFEILGATGITGQELGGVAARFFQNAGTTPTSAKWRLLSSLTIFSDPPELPLNLLRFSIFSNDPLGTGTFAVNRVNLGSSTTLFTGSLPVPNATPIPTPALLPGLLALGVATLKKRQGDPSKDVDEATEA